MAASPAVARKKHHEPPPPVPAPQLPAKSGPPIVPTIEARARELIDMDAESVRARLGQPKLLRREPPAEVWQYADDSCVLLLIFYDPKSGKGPARVQYSQGRMLPGHETEAARCLSGPPSTAAPNTSVQPSASPAVIPNRPLSGTPVYSLGDPPPPAK
jgi:hypothetical protein